MALPAPDTSRHPRDPQLAYEFLKVEPRKIRHNGVQRGNLMYGGAVLSELADRKSPYRGRFANRWPIHVDPDNVSHVFIKHPDTHEWHELKWQLADEYPMAFSDEGYQYARKTRPRQTWLRRHPNGHGRPVHAVQPSNGSIRQRA